MLKVYSRPQDLCINESRFSYLQWSCSKTDPININSKTKQYFMCIYLQTQKHVKRSGGENIISVVEELSGTPRPHAAVHTA